MTEMASQERQIDLGHLMAVDPLHHFPSPPASRLGFLFFILFLFLIFLQFVGSWSDLGFLWDVCGVPWNFRPNFKTRVIGSKFEC